MLRSRIEAIGAPIAVATRELTWVAPRVEREVGAWRRRALTIPDRALREDALATLRRERLNTEGAALFAVLPRRRLRPLLELSVAYQIAFDYLDTIGERPAGDRLANGRQLHRALVEALSGEGPVSDYYRHHPWRDDGGYLAALIDACRRGCAALPSYPVVRAAALEHAHRFAVQAINHDRDERRRNDALSAWERGAGAGGLLPFELAAGASSSLLMHALFALAAEPAASARDVVAVCDAYFPWICAASTLLDSFVDEDDDVVAGEHRYVAHYPSLDVAVARLREIVRQSVARARRLRRGPRHALIATGMVAMYLSKESARGSALRSAACTIAGGAGPMLRIQLAILRAVRRLRGLRRA
jgi:tetraprenyl-beta-curcumene synthase